MALNTKQSSSLYSEAITLQHYLLAQSKEKKKAHIHHTVQTAPIPITRNWLENSITADKPEAIPA